MLFRSPKLTLLLTVLLDLVRGAILTLSAYALYCALCRALYKDDNRWALGLTVDASEHLCVAGALALVGFMPVLQAGGCVVGGLDWVAGRLGWWGVVGGQGEGEGEGLGGSGGGGGGGGEGNGAKGEQDGGVELEEVV